MDCDSVLVALVVATFFMPVLEVTTEFAGPGRGEYGMDVIALGRDTEINESHALGLRHRGGYHFNERFQIEGLVGASLDNDSQCASAILVAGVAHFRPQRKVEPYLGLGIGQASRDLDVLFDVNDSGLAGHLMAGGRFFFTQHRVVALRVEAGLLAEDTFDVITTHPSLTIGMTWRMGSSWRPRP